jgi:tetratricopeptide (TPR) repeat protein
VARCPTCRRRLASGQPCPDDGAIAIDTRASDPEEPPPWPHSLGPCIGTGGFASVWAIDDARVLKIAHADHELARARMSREAEALAAVGAPAVPAVFDRGVVDGRAWIVMERIAGTPVADLVPVKANHVVAMGVAIATGIERIHATRFVHRDIKPDNLVRRADGTIAILDLGLARKLPTDPADPTRAGVQVGSLEYIAPEQITDSTSVDERSDLYAVGCVLYELCAGRPPFLGDPVALERAHAALRPPPLGALAEVPAALEAVVHDCLAKDRARRPASARELCERLEATRADVSIAKSGHRRQVIGEGAQPVVLLWAELPRVDRALLALLQARRVTMVSQRGRRVLGGIVGAEHPDPASAAIATARDLAAAGARVALHLDALRVTTAGGAYKLEGAGEAWLPAQPWTGVVLSRALATVTREATRPAGEGWVALAGEDAATELFGRDAFLADLAADATAALERKTPALGLVVGDHGVGKTAFTAALAKSLAELGIRTHVAAVPQPGTGRAGASALAELIGTPAGPIVRGVGDALRAAARERPLAVILDDLHLADHELLDALEYATLGGEAVPLWVLGLASPRFEIRRPGFGERAERHRRDVLGPLDEDAAVAMTAALLRPAEYPPLRTLRQLAGLARGNPLHLATLAREIRERGAIRTRPNGEHFLDTSALDSLPPLALGPWLAARELAPLGVELVALARLCAVLGDELDRDELGAVVAAVEASGGATTTIDVDVGIRELVGAAILVPTERGWTFRQILLEEGVYATTADAERLAIHHAALAYWRVHNLESPSVAARIARHAEAAGDRREAAAAYTVLAEQAHREHRALDADQAWQAALRNLDAGDTARSKALLGRARERYRLQRVREALVDLDEARAIAVAIGDVELELEILLERTTALYWSDEYDASAALVDELAARVPATSPLTIDLAVAKGRTLFGYQRWPEAVAQLRPALAAARAANRHEAEIIAAVVLAPSLAESGELDAAEQVFAELIARCEESGDRVHLAACYANRAFLWSARGEVHRTAEDLRYLIQICREIGQPTLERIGTHNLAEDLLWQGELDEATRLARRCIAIQRAHGESAVLWDDLLLARILAARGERIELAPILDKLDEAELEPRDRAMIRVLRCVAKDSGPAAWREALQQSAALPADRRVELSHLAVQRGMLTVEERAEVRELATRHPIWLRRLAEL